MSDLKKCSRCQVLQPLDEYHIKRNGGNRKDYRRGVCRTCRSARVSGRWKWLQGFKAAERPDPEHRPELLDYQCWLPGCCRPSLEGDVICAFHACVFAEEGAR